MALPILDLDLDESAFTIAFGNEILSARVQSGPSRRRRDFIGATDVVAVQWVLDGLQYQVLMSFYRTTLVNGILPFQMDMVVDGGALAPYECSFIESTLQLTGKSGDAFIVTANLEATPSTANPDYDASIAMLYGIYGDTAPDILNSLSKLVNVDLPMTNPYAD